MSPSWTKAHDSRKKLHMKPMQLSVCKQHAFPEILSLLSSKISPSHTPRSTLGCRACSGASTNVMLFLKVPPTMVLNEKSFMCHSTTTPGASSQNNTMHGSHGSYRFSAQCALFFLCSGALHVVVSSCCLFFLLDCPSRSPFVVCILIRNFLVSVSFLNPLVQTSCPGLTFKKRVSFADLYLHKLNLETKWNQ